VPGSPIIQVGAVAGVHLTTRISLRVVVPLIHLHLIHQCGVAKHGLVGVLLLHGAVLLHDTGVDGDVWRPSLSRGRPAGPLSSHLSSVEGTGRVVGVAGR